MRHIPSSIVQHTNFFSRLSNHAQNAVKKKWGKLQIQKHLSVTDKGKPDCKYAIMDTAAFYSVMTNKTVFINVSGL